MAERRLPKPKVAGSRPVFRSILLPTARIFLLYLPNTGGAFVLLTAISRITEHHKTFATSGNASERRLDVPHTFWITPSGVGWSDIGLADLVMLSVQTGEVVSGTLRPSTEWRAHQAIYSTHPWVGGIVHLHSLYATILSVIGIPVLPVHYQMARVGDQVPVVPYQTFGTTALARRVAETIASDTRAVLIENHGLFAVGDSADDALRAADEVEWTAEVQYRAMLVKSPRVLTRDELSEARDAFRTYGQNPTSIS